MVSFSFPSKCRHVDVRPVRAVVPQLPPDGAEWRSVVRVLAPAGSQQEVDVLLTQLAQRRAQRLPQEWSSQLRDDVWREAAEGCRRFRSRLKYPGDRWVLTFGFQVDVLIGAGLGVVHDFPQDDGKAVDVALGRPPDWAVHLPQKFWCRPVHIYKTARLK